MLRLTRKSHFCFPSNFRNSRFSISSSWRYPFKHNYTTTLQLDTLLPKEYPENSSTSASSTNSTLNTSRSHSPASPFNTTNQKSKSKWNTFDKISSLPTTSSTFSSFPPYHLDPIIISSPFTPINMQTKMKRKDKLISTNVYRNSFKINEAFAFIHVMLESGDIQRAEEIYHGLSHATLDTVQTLENTQLFNLFIKAYIQQMKQTKIDTTASLNKALLWFMKIKKRHFEPDVTSYALILHGLVFAEQEKELHAHILEVKETASPDFLEALLQHPLLLNDLSSSSYNYLNAVLASHDLRLPELSSTLSDEGNKEDLLSTSPSAQEDTKKQLYKDNEWYATQLHINSIDAVDSKGLGFLQTILKHLKVLDPHQETFQLHALQLKLETYSYMASFEKYSQTLEKAPSIALHSESIKNLLWEWHVALTAKFKEEMKSHSTFTTEDKRKTLSTLLKIDFDESPWAYLKLLSPEKLSKITIIEMLLLISKFKNGDVDPLQHISTSFCSHRLTSLLPSLGDAIANEIQFENTKKHFKEKIPDPASSYYNNYIKDFKLGSQRLLRLRFSHLRSILENNKEEPVDSTPPSSSTSTTAMTTTSTTTSSTTSTADTVSSDSEELIACLQKFPISLRAKFGGVALKLFCEICMFKRHYTHSETGAGLSETVPACYHSFEYIKNKKVGILKVTPSFLEFLCKESGYQSFPPRMLPMVVKPQPWSHVTYGGYLTRRTLCMQLKHHSVEQRAYLLEAAKRKRLNAILASLDVLGETAWQIHADVLRVVVEAWNSGEAIADFPILYTPSKIKELEPTKPDDFDNNPAAKIKYYKESQIFQTNVQNAFSLRCDNNYKLEIARSFLGYKLYFPHHIDFRGRAYPSPPLLNHMASDLSRGLLTFAESKVLGERGWFWLKVHLASLYGIDKESFSKREEWVMNHIENIFDSVDNPLSGQRWWLKCDDPWQFLAACFEVTKAIRSGNPVTYACSLPIHQDGTCNGLQHYAALGGDISGAKQVNLIKGERPADVYLAVAALVQKEIHADSNKGNELAKILDGKITRKIVKQTVMTFVYGVTFIGARNQLLARLKETMDLDSLTQFKVSSYLASKVLGSIKHLFNRAQELQHWLNTVAHIIAHSVPPDVTSNPTPFRNCVAWTTPLGLTCTQPYRREKTCQVETALQCISLFDPTTCAPVNSQKQKTGFPPNFVHSLDSTHMMMTAIECYRLGLTFAAVHDSYWTHASDIDQMNLVIREMFVKLHSEPILENLLQEFKLRYQGHKMPAKLMDKFVYSTPSSSSFKPTETKSKSQIHSIHDLAQELNVDFLLDLQKNEMNKVKDVNEEDEIHEISSTNTGVNTNNKSIAYVPIEFPPLPRKGNFNIRNVLDSDYFFH